MKNYTEQMEAINTELNNSTKRIATLDFIRNIIILTGIIFLTMTFTTIQF